MYCSTLFLVGSQFIFKNSSKCGRIKALHSKRRKESDRNFFVDEKQLKQDTMVLNGLG